MDNNEYSTNNYNPTNYNPNNYGPGKQPYNNPYTARRPFGPNSDPMTLKDWMLTYLLLLIPFANLVLPFIWAFGSDVNKSKKSYFQAYLIFILIRIAISLIVSFFFISFFLNFIKDIYGQLAF